jgi:hypothetical protein
MFAAGLVRQQLVELRQGCSTVGDRTTILLREDLADSLPARTPASVCAERGGEQHGEHGERWCMCAAMRRAPETHSHDFHQVVLPLVGCLELGVGGRGGQVVGLTGALLTSGERHAFAASARNEFLVLDLPHAVVEEAGTGEWLERWGRTCFFPSPARRRASAPSSPTR